MRYIQNKLLVLLLCLCPTFLYAEYIQSIEIHNKEKIKLNAEELILIIEIGQDN